jgi:hypothetical protein
MVYGVPGDIADPLEILPMCLPPLDSEFRQVAPSSSETEFFYYLGHRTSKSFSEMCDLVPAGQFAIGADPPTWK